MSDNQVEITLKMPAYEAMKLTSGHPEDPGELLWCKGCLRDIEEGQTMVYLAGRHMHEGCARKRLPADHPADAWLVIARHIATYPSRHDAATIRATMLNLIAMVMLNETATPPVTG